MQEYIQSITLVALLVFLFYTERTMRSKIENMPSQTVDVEDKISGMTEVLDDIADLLNEGLQSLTGASHAQTPSNPMEAILSGLISSMTSKANHGPTTQERTIHEIDPTPNESQTENELD